MISIVQQQTSGIGVLGRECEKWNTQRGKVERTSVANVCIHRSNCSNERVLMV